MNIKNFSDMFLSFIFTKRCRFCNKICNVTDEICEDCDKDLHKVEGEICYNCGISKTKKAILEMVKDRYFDFPQYISYWDGKKWKNI